MDRPHNLQRKSLVYVARKGGGKHGTHELILLYRVHRVCFAWETRQFLFSSQLNDQCLSVHPEILCVESDKPRRKVKTKGMAQLNTQEKTADHEVQAQHSLRSLLCSKERDFFIRNNGEKVKVEELEGKVVGLYFSAHWCRPCRSFTPVLSDIYTKLLEKVGFEIIFISADVHEESFAEYHSIMPWLALPFSDAETRDKLDEKFQVSGIPTLVILDKKGRTIRTDGVEIIEEFGVQAYPFTTERLHELKAEEAALRDAQTVESLLVSDERDFVIGHGGKVRVSELVGKTVCLYFSAHWCGPCQNFTPQLVQIYNELKKKGEALEIVFISDDREEHAFQEYYGSMPWLALPFGDKTEKILSRYFQIQGIPTLIVLGPDGKTVQTEAVELIRDYGVHAYPFTTERLHELEAQEEARRETETLESLLVSDERDFVIKHGGEKVPVAELRGKTVALYFSAHWYPPCCAFTPRLIQVYNELKERGEGFEIVFISTDRDQEAFEDYYASMPWLALPLEDKTQKDLRRIFRVKGIPTLIVIGPDGKTVTNDAVSIVSIHGAKAYPFTDAQLVKLQEEIEELAKNSPKEMKHSLHGHSLALTQKQDYNCDACDEEGIAWSYYCEDCDFDLHLACALKDEHCVGSDEKQQELEAAPSQKSKPSGVICEGDVCYRA
eukprot:Gb_30883 [translate_table: standard]